MNRLLALVRLIDRLSETVGRGVPWLILVLVLVSTGNAMSRKLFSASSNALLEIQWTLFAAVFLLAAAHTLRRNEHVRIDVLSARLSPRTRALIDIVGGLFFLLPFASLVFYHGWTFFWESFVSAEHSSSPGGLILWPGKLLIPLGFALLWLQGVAEVLRRIAFLAGHGPEPEPPRSPEGEGMILRETGQ